MQPATLSLQGRHAFVSGATQGIGKATAIAMAAAGATVTVCGRNDQGLVRALEALPAPRTGISPDMQEPAASPTRKGGETAG